MDSATFIFLTVLDNRVTEAFKRAIAIQFPNLKDEVASLFVLLFSFVVGIAGVLFLFPSVNVFAGQGASILSEQFATGIVIGGLANGVDFLATRIARPDASSKSTLSLVETHEESKAA